MIHTYFVESGRFKQIEPRRSFFERMGEGDGMDAYQGVFQIIGGALVVVLGGVLGLAAVVFCAVMS